MSKPIYFGMRAAALPSRTERDDIFEDLERQLAQHTPAPTRSPRQLPNPVSSAVAGLQVDRTTFVEGVRRGAVASRQTQAIRTHTDDGSLAVIFGQAIADAAANLNRTRRHSA